MQPGVLAVVGKALDYGRMLFFDNTPTVESNSFSPSLFSLRSRFRIDQFRALWKVGRSSIQRLVENLGALLSTFHLPAAKIVASGVFLPDGKYVLGYFGQKICPL